MFNLKSYLEAFAVCAVLLTGFVSCRKDAPVQERQKIVFGGSMLIDGEGGETKGLDPIDLLNIRNMKVYATVEESGDFDSESVIGNYFSGVCANKNETTGLFDTEGEYFWPLSGKLSFFSIAPSDAEAVCDESLSGGMHLTVTPSSDIKSQKDICYATPRLNLSRSEDPVDFSFHHCMTYVYFSANFLDNGMVAEKGYKVKVDSLSISGVKGSRELTIAPDGSFSWSDKADPPAKIQYKLSRGGGHLTQDDIVKSIGDSPEFTPITSLNGRLYLLPQKLEGAKLNLVYSFVKDEGKEELVSSFHVEVPLPDNIEWEQSKHVHYRLTIDLMGLTELEISASAGEWIEDWTAHNSSTHKYDIK